MEHELLDASCRDLSPAVSKEATWNHLLQLESAARVAKGARVGPESSHLQSHMAYVLNPPGERRYTLILRTVRDCFQASPLSAHTAIHCSAKKYF